MTVLTFLCHALARELGLPEGRECNVCEGSGELPMALCQTCNGTGTLPWTPATLAEAVREREKRLVKAALSKQDEIVVAAEAFCHDPWDNDRRDRLRAALRPKEE